MKIACCIRDEPSFREVHSVLSQHALGCERFSSDIALLRALRQHSFELVLVDIGNGMQDSESIFSWLNCRSGDTSPVIAIGAQRNADLLAIALEAGADDFVGKPLEGVELIARINAQLRRSGRHQRRRTIEFGKFMLDREASRFCYEGTPIELTPREFTIAWLFFSSPGVYISRRVIATAIWGVDSDIAGRTIEQHVYKLRKKLQLGSERGMIIRTAYSQGYRLEPLEES